MAEQSDSLKDEMSEALRADRERARERPPHELPQTTTSEPEPPAKQSFLRKLFG